jgi:thiol-disulfide isomerase/thioredoxin
MATLRTCQLAETLDHDRRRFLGTAAMTMAGMPFGIFATAEAQSRDSREFAAIGRATEWLNSSRLTAASLAGKVVLVDFWTYTCINWLRTLPYVRAWSQKYRDRLVVVGVHTPEFPFEHSVANVRRAVQQMKIEYPVVIDSDYAIWRAFSNQYWPAYFIDARGKIRDHRFGEGDYDSSEKVIQRLLAEAGVSGVANGLVSADPPAEANRRPTLRERVP